jgi:hypothetical protein
MPPVHREIKDEFRELWVSDKESSGLNNSEIKEFPGCARINRVAFQRR